jgi:predicted metalloprotease with PDZ domain
MHYNANKLMVIRILTFLAGTLFILDCRGVAAGFSTAASKGARQQHILHPTRHSRAQSSTSPLFIGTGFSFNDGNQVLVSVQKPLGIILGQDDGDDKIVAVVDMDPTGSAARAGVKVGDVLVAVQNTSVEGQSLEYALDFISQAPRVLNLRFVRPNEGSDKA